MQSFINHYGYFGIFVLSVLSSACLPIPSEVAYGFAGALCTTAITGHAQFTVVGVIIDGTLGSLVGAVIAYEVGRTAGRTIVDRWGKWLLLTHKDLDSAERWFARYGAISVPAGLAEMKRGRFVVLTTIGSAAWVALLAGLGYAAGSNWDRVSKDFHYAQYPIIVLIVVALGLAFWHRLRAVRRHNAG